MDDSRHAVVEAGVGSCRRAETARRQVCSARRQGVVGANQMINVITGIVTLVTLVTLGGDARAEGGTKKEKAKDAFARLDVDASGSLSLEEFVAAREGEKAERAKRIFAKIDADADGSVTKDEFKAGAKHRAEMKD
ncbi:MAG: EF-hand domain-containing protein [Deltaproteobacteria bacterium]|nr:EF-hand domain-containing protein [Deltaproteobacteria bacterium]